MTPTEKMIEAQRQRSAAYKEADDFYNQQNAYAVEISTLRKQVGLTQKQLAERIGVPQSTIARWESGDSNITMKNMEKIARAVHKKLVVTFK